MRLLLCSLMVLLPLATSLSAQAWDTLSLNDLSAFKDPPANWKVVGEATLTPSAEAFKKEKGSGIVLNEAPSGKGGDLITNWTHGDLDVELEFQLTPGSNSGIYLQGNYEIQLLDSWGKDRAGFADVGGVYQRWVEEEKSGYEGYAPAINAAKAPGLWQKLSIVFRAPRFDEYGQKVANARILSVHLNGVLLHENIELTGPTRGGQTIDDRPKGPLRIQGDHGPVAIRGLRYRSYYRPPLSWERLDFKVAKMSSLGSREIEEVVSSGKIDAISTYVTQENGNLAIEYDGYLNLPATGIYTFALDAWNPSSLMIDGEAILDDVEGRHTVDVELSEGRHRVRLRYFKFFPWTSKLLTLTLAGPGLTPQNLHNPAEIPYGNLPSSILVDFDRRPVILRSYVDVPKRGGGIKRLNHVVHVGFPSGIAYTYYLGTGNLLRSWRGGFMDATKSWSGRGDGSMTPMGVVTEHDTLATWSGAADGSFRPALTEIDVRPKGFKLEDDGSPVFHYELGTAKVKDKLQDRSEGKGLKRVIEWEGQVPTEGYWRLAAGTSIVESRKGLYRVDDRFFVRLPDKATTQLSIRTSEGRKELVAVSTEGNRLEYDIIW